MVKIERHKDGVIVYFSLREKELFDEITDILYPDLQPQDDSLEDPNIKAHFAYYNYDEDKYVDLMLVKKYPKRNE